jgi:single-strand DNA-binding protein
MSYHTIIIAGALGGDPELRYTPSGQAVTNFSLAADDSYTNSSGERVKRTVWFRVAAWGKLGEVCNQYLAKGRKVLVEGKLGHDDSGNPKTYTRQDGSAGASFEINANTVRFLSSASDGNGRTESEPAGQSVPQDDVIPF